VVTVVAVPCAMEERYGDASPWGVTAELSVCCGILGKKCGSKENPAAK